MEKSGKSKTRESCKLKMGLDEFLDMVFANKSVDAKITCPCKNCGNESTATVKVAKDHLKAVGFTESCSKIIGPAKVTSSVLYRSKTSGENEMNVVDEANAVELFTDFEEGILPPGLKGRKLQDFIAKLLQLKYNEKNPDKLDKSISSMLFEFTKELFPVREVADPTKSFCKFPFVLGEEKDMKNPREKQNQPRAASTLFGCEEDEKTTLGENRNQPSASTSSGLVGCSTKEEQRRKLREKINQRKESRWRIR